MKPRLYSGLSEEDKNQIKQEYGQSPYFVERLTELLQEDIDKSLERMRRAAKDGTPNLTEVYADELATQRTLDYVINLLKS